MTKPNEIQSMLHGEKLSDALKAEHVDPIPRDGSEHARSHAAHLDTEGKVHTTPEGYGKQGREPGTVNQPPQDPRRSGKTHARQ